MSHKKRLIRKVTFTVRKDKGVRAFKPANKRAKRYAYALRGRKTAKLDANDLRTIEATGVARCYVYGKGELKRVSL